MFFTYCSEPLYFSEHLRILPSEDKLKLEKICYLLYMSYLIQFHRLKAKDFRSRTGRCCETYATFCIAIVYNCIYWLR